MKQREGPCRRCDFYQGAVRTSQPACCSFPKEYINGRTAVLEGPLGDSLARGSPFIAGQATAPGKVLQRPRCEFFSSPKETQVSGLLYWFPFLPGDKKMLVLLLTHLFTVFVHKRNGKQRP